MQTHRKALKIFLQFSINFRNFCTTPCTNLLLLNTINLLTGLKDKLNSIYNQGFKAKINFFLDGFLTYLYMSRQFGGAEGSNPPGVKGLSVCSSHLCSSLGPQPIDIHSGDRWTTDSKLTVGLSVNGSFYMLLLEGLNTCSAFTSGLGQRQLGNCSADLLFLLLCICFESEEQWYGPTQLSPWKDCIPLWIKCHRTSRQTPLITLKTARVTGTGRLKRRAAVFQATL